MDRSTGFCQWSVFQKQLPIDVQYYSGHPTKLFFKDKPVRFCYTNYFKIDQAEPGNHVVLVFI